MSSIVVGYLHIRAWVQVRASVFGFIDLLSSISSETADTRTAARIICLKPRQEICKSKVASTTQRLQKGYYGLYSTKIQYAGLGGEDYKQEYHGIVRRSSEAPRVILPGLYR